MATIIDLFNQVHDTGGEIGIQSLSDCMESIKEKGKKNETQNVYQKEKG